MKYLTIEWWRNCQAGLHDDAIARYRAHVSTLRDRLPAGLPDLQESVSLHDGQLLSLALSSSDKTATLQIRLSDGLVVRLIHGGVEEFSSTQSPEMALPGPDGLGDLGYDKADESGGGLFEHRLLFSISIELVFRFKSLELQYGNRGGA